MKRPSKQFCLICLLALFGHMATAVASTSTAPMPNNFVVLYLTPSSFEIGWGETEGYGKWGVVLTDGEVELSRSTTTYPHMVFNNLQPDQDYEIAIYSVDENNTWLEHITRTVHTPCTGMSDLPYIQDFESLDGNTLPHCWQAIERGTAHYSIYTPGTDYRENYGKCISINHLDAGRIYLILPAVDTANYPVNTLQLHFRAQETTAGSAPICTIGVMTDPASAGSYMPVELIEIIDDGGWHEYTASLFDFSGWGSYITLQMEGDGLSQCFKIDDIELEEIPACPRVEQLEVSNITRNSAVVSWVNTNYGSSWDVEYGSHGFTLGTGTRITAYDTTLTLTGLTASTVYDLYVISNCGTEMGGVRRTMFHTTCVIDAIPYEYDFDENLTYLSCWTPLNLGQHFAPRVDEGVLIWNNQATDGHGCVSLPPFDEDIDISELNFSFSAEITSVDSTEVMLEVGMMENPHDASTFDLLAQVALPSNGTRNVSIPLANYAGQGRNLAIRTSADTAQHGNWQLRLDDILIDNYTAPTPTGLTVSNITSNSAELTWNGGADFNDWEIEVSTAQGEAETYTSQVSQYHLTNLQPSTTYQVSVRSVSTSGSASAWCQPVSFTTLATERIGTTETPTFSIYPNPATTSFTISPNGEQQTLRISIIDINGREVMTETIAASRSIDVSRLPKGTYIVIINQGGNKSTQRLTIR